MLLNGDDDRKVNVSMVSSGGVHWNVCREQNDIIVNVLKNIKSFSIRVEVVHSEIVKECGKLGLSWLLEICK